MTESTPASTLVSRFDYPSSRPSDHVEVLHGIEISDPYRWLEATDADHVGAWIAAQNELTYGFLEGIPQRDSIRGRMTELWRYERFGIPIKRGGRYFFTQNDGLQNQDVLFWAESMDEEPRLLLDPNILSAEGTVALMGRSVSRDGRLLAYGLSDSGSDWQIWRVRDVESGQDLSDELRWVKWSAASWTQDNRGFFYSRYDKPESEEAYSAINYGHKLYFHRVGDRQEDDALLFAQPDQKEWLFHGEVTEDGRYLVITVAHGTHREQNILYCDLEAGRNVVELLSEFRADYQFVGNDGENFFFLTDDGAARYRVVSIDIRQPEAHSWREIVAEADSTLQSASLVGDKLIAIYLVDATSQVSVFSSAGSFERTIDLGCIGSVAGFEGSRDDPETFYKLTGFTTPESIYRFDVNSGEQRLLRQPAVDFDPDDFVTRQVWVRSNDGSRAPLYLTHRRDLVLNGETPTYLYGYGGFNIPLTPTFSVSNLVWMERGGIYAHAILRGGGEYGKEWHMAGAKLEKQTSSMTSSPRQS
ncbi:MAG: prolyl oligopeptidase family serine peptidase, partial [Caldilineaceae bacterium]|nr:prolyl oligopeptidase family serine peptidase [Caldilineaceae bacterium]